MGNNRNVSRKIAHVNGKCRMVLKDTGVVFSRCLISARARCCIDGFKARQTNANDRVLAVAISMME